MNTTSQESLAVQELLSHSVAEVPRQSASASALMMNDASMDKMIRMAELMAHGRSTIPKHLQGNVGDCMAVVMQAMQWNMNPFAVAQKTHIVNGTLGYEAQLVAAVINNSGAVQDRFNFEWFGDWTKIIGKFIEKDSRKNPGEKYRAPGWVLADEKGLGIRVWCTLKGEIEPRVLELLLSQAGVRNSTLWADDPKQQLAYLAQKRWARLYAPDVILGVYDPGEMESSQPKNMGAADVIKPEASEELVHQADMAASKGVAAYQEFWAATGPLNRKLLVDHHPGMKQRASEADKLRTVDTPAETPAAAAEAEKPQDDAVVMTFAKVMDMLVKSKTVQALEMASDWIGEVADPEQRTELVAKYEALRTAMVA